jgi:hypothetical protein
MKIGSPERRITADLARSPLSAEVSQPGAGLPCPIVYHVLVL